MLWFFFKIGRYKNYSNKNEDMLTKVRSVLPVEDGGWWGGGQKQRAGCRPGGAKLFFSQNGGRATSFTIGMRGKVKLWGGWWWCCEPTSPNQLSWCCGASPPSTSLLHLGWSGPACPDRHPEDGIEFCFLFFVKERHILFTMWSFPPDSHEPIGPSWTLRSLGSPLATHQRLATVKARNQRRENWFPE